MSNKHVDEGGECVDDEDDFNFQVGLKDLQKAVDILNSLCIDDGRGSALKREAVLLIESGIGLCKFYR